MYIHIHEDHFSIALYPTPFLCNNMDIIQYRVAINGAVSETLVNIDIIYYVIMAEVLMLTGK